MSIQPYLSIVIPAYNEEGNVEAIYQALLTVLEPMGKDFEILFSDDGSADNTFTIIQRLNLKDNRIKGIALSRNFGNQVALFAGLQAARGEYVVTMDADLQHPPEFIVDLLAQHDIGYDIVNARRIDYQTNTFFKKWSSKVFYKVINFLSDVPIEAAHADFRSMSRKALDAYLSMPERLRFSRGLVKWMGFEQVTIGYKELNRHSGQTKFSYGSLMRLGLDGVMSFSVKPLRISLYVGGLVSTGALVYGIFEVVMYFMGRSVPGFTSLVLTILFLGGTILLSLGIIGEYIARIYNEVRERPMYFIKDSTDFQSKSNESHQDRRTQSA